MEQLELLDRRVAQLEVQNKLLRAVTGGIALIATAAILSGQRAPSRVVEAEGFVLTSGGKTQARLESTPQGARLVMYDSAQRVRTALHASADRPGIMVFDSDQRLRAELTLEVAPFPWARLDLYGEPSRVFGSPDPTTLDDVRNRQGTKATLAARPHMAAMTLNSGSSLTVINHQSGSARDED
jgi:hypothetical protein